MSRHQYNQIMTYGLRSRQKPSKPDKISNFVGRVKRIKVFIGSLTYICDFMILEDTSSIIESPPEQKNGFRKTLHRRNRPRTTKKRGTSSISKVIFEDKELGSS
ncbi:hypothetical protein Tco_0770652 [Tanacetum coccineum]|uniref:Uncharacterized protein n=1 Tax=Tanacetum coccineum TaxID=301880 RepID=A0ABQ4ZER3_9ASTR